MKNLFPLQHLKGILRRPLTFQRILIAGLIFTIALFAFVGLSWLLVRLVFQILPIIPKDYAWVFYAVGFVLLMFLLFVYGLSEEQLNTRIRNFLIGSEDTKKFSEDTVHKE